MRYFCLSLFLTFFPALVFAESPVFPVTLDVPFTAQAPYGNWAEPWQNACEETSITMIDAYYGGFTLPPEMAKSGIEKVLKLKESIYGPSLDEPAREIVEVINRFFPWEAHIVESPTLEDLIGEIDAGRPIIIPAHGTYLENSYFRTSQLDYHVFVLSGYDLEKREFISQEPGTQFGEDYRYPFDVLMHALHDFVPDATEFGSRYAIFTSPFLTRTAHIDGDRDGLTKQEEIAQGTVLWLMDSDGDGYGDGEEVQHGYSPTVAEKLLPTGSLIKTAHDPHVYFYTGFSKRHITSAEAFLRRGFRWQDIVIVSNAFLQPIPVGSALN